MNKDLEHLRLLSIFHYVAGGLIALFACFPIIHLSMGIMILSGEFPKPPTAAGEPDPFQFVGVMFIVLPLIFIIGGWALAVCTIIAGRKLAKRQSYMFCFVMAAVLCVFMPFGTVLGVFTIIVLMRDSVKQLFSGREYPPGGNQTGFNPPSWK